MRFLTPHYAPSSAPVVVAPPQLPSPAMAQVSVRNPLLGDHTPPERNTTSFRNKILVAATAIIVVVTLLYCGNFDTKALGGPWIGEVPRRSGNGGYVIETEVGAVAAEDGRCAEIGASALKNGGHAVDAAVATTICLGVVNPMSSGIGGGGFMVLRSAESRHAQAYDFRETAPLAASQNMYEKNPKDKAEGPLSMGVPGEVAGLHTAWLEHGRLPWWSLFQPSIQLARSGFVVAACLAEYMHYSKDQIMADPGLREVFAPNGKLLRKGDTCYNLKLAHTLEVIAKQGASAFYNGTIGESLVRDVQEAGGILTIEDLRQYKVKVTDALAVDVMGHTILGMPPPSTGTVGLAMVLKILESYGTADAAKGPLGLHRLLESLKHMLAIRMNLGDPDFVNITRYVADMLSSSYATQIRHKILDNTTFPSGYYLPRWKQIKDHGTSHFCIVDANRNALSMTSTVNDHFGAGVISLSTGIVLNNEMDDFSLPTETNTDGLPPSVSNYIQPKKRPISAMTPVIILKDNQLAGVLGGSGGLYIPPGVIQVFLDHFVFGMEPLASVQHPRVYHKLTPNIVLYENWTVYDGDHFELPNKSVKFLEQRGHILQAQPRGSGCQLIVYNLPNTVRIQGKDGSGGLNNGVFHGTLTAVSDPRKYGRPAGI